MEQINVSLQQQLTHLDRLDQRAVKRDVVLDGVAVDDVPQKYCRVDSLVDLQVQAESREVPCNDTSVFWSGTWGACITQRSRLYK